MRRNWLLIAVAAATAAVLGYAWLDAGREPVRPIAVTIPVPESAR